MRETISHVITETNEKKGTIFIENKCKPQQQQQAAVEKSTAAISFLDTLSMSLKNWWNLFSTFFGLYSLEVWLRLLFFFLFKKCSFVTNQNHKNTSWWQLRRRLQGITLAPPGYCVGGTKCPVICLDWKWWKLSQRSIQVRKKQKFQTQ